jgi:hypothetical protein
MVESKCETSYLKTKVKYAPPPNFKVQGKNILTFIPHKFDPKKELSECSHALTLKLAEPHIT